MESTEMEAILNELVHRVGNIEQKLPHLVTRDEFQIAMATLGDDLRGEMARMEARLEGRMRSTASKDDLGQLEARVEARMATKEDLAQLEARMEARMATQEDLARLEKQMATKDDLARLEEQMATKDDLARLEERMATKDDLDAVVRTLLDIGREQAVETRRHFDVVAESLRGDLRLLAEGHISLAERHDRLSERVERVELGIADLRQRL